MLAVNCKDRKNYQPTSQEQPKTEKITEFIALDGQPLLVVENERYCLLSRNSFLETAVPEMSTTVCKQCASQKR